LWPHGAWILCAIHTFALAYLSRCGGLHGSSKSRPNDRVCRAQREPPASNADSTVLTTDDTAALPDPHLFYPVVVFPGSLGGKGPSIGQTRGWPFTYQRRQDLSRQYLSFFLFPLSKEGRRIRANRKRSPALSPLRLSSFWRPAPPLPSCQERAASGNAPAGPKVHSAGPRCTA
jgi:hypothetical protein